MKGYKIYAWSFVFWLIIFLSLGNILLPQEQHFCYFSIIKNLVHYNLRRWLLFCLILYEVLIVTFILFYLLDLY